MEKATNKKSQILWDEYKQDMTKNWNKIWFLVIDICKSLVLKYCKQRRLSFHDDLIYTRSMDAATTVMGRIKKGKAHKIARRSCFGGRSLKTAVTKKRLLMKGRFR